MSHFRSRWIGASAATIAKIVAACTIVAKSDAQEVVEIDYDSGRHMISDQWRSIHIEPRRMAVDRARGTLYVRDDEEPNGVIAFSLATGEWLRTYRFQRGGGPRELAQGWAGMASGSGGRLYVSGIRKVLEFDSLGRYVSHWQPRVPERRAVCDLGGQPAVPGQAGVLRRRLEGGDEAVGRGFIHGSTIRVANIDDVASVDEGMSLDHRIFNASMVCDETTAYVAFDYEDGPDSVFVYSRQGKEGRLPVPNEFTGDRPKWNRRLTPTSDGRGNVVLIGYDDVVPAAIVDPDTRCYAMIRNRRHELSRSLVRVYRDSALVVHRHTVDTVTSDGTPATLRYSTAHKVSLHPFQRVSGEPCPGMLPSAKAREGRAP